MLLEYIVKLNKMVYIFNIFLIYALTTYHKLIIVPEAPAALKALVMSTESVLVSWKPPAEPNGEINQYTVYIQPSGDNKDVCILFTYYYVQI